MIVITGAAGFIGSCLLKKFNDEEKKTQVVVVDDFSNSAKNKNLISKSFSKQIERKVFFSWLNDNYKDVTFVLHIGARTDTAEFDRNVLNELNLNYSKELWQLCTLYQLPLIYASSAATYGLGERGYEDNHDIIPLLKPLNPYGESKNDFDKWVLQQSEKPPYWAGLKFFNVYGPNEYHKGRMASVVLHAFSQIKETGGIKLFKSHNPNFKDGMQLRDFVYVKDVTEVCLNLYRQKKHCGIYNLGTGKARTFLDLAKATFDALDLTPKISFIDTPKDIRDNYQYFTEADMNKLKSIGYAKPFTSLENGISDYVKNYLSKGLYF